MRACLWFRWMGWDKERGYTYQLVNNSPFQEFRRVSSFLTTLVRAEDGRGFKLTASLCMIRRSK